MPGAKVVANFFNYETTVGVSVHRRVCIDPRHYRTQSGTAMVLFPLLVHFLADPPLLQLATFFYK